jgi:isopentenyl phosphate kinase
MILASANAAVSPRGMARGGWKTGRRRKERVSSCGSVWGRIAPPPDKEFVGGGGSFGHLKTSALDCVTATMTLAEARADIGFRLLA